MLLKKLSNWLVVICLPFVIGACGGGGSDAGTPPWDGGGGTGGGTADQLTVELSLGDTTVTAVSPVTVTAKVTKGTKVLSGKVVKFSVESGLGSLSSPAGLTNSQGLAVVALTPADSSVGGADTVTAEVTVDGETASASSGFQLTATEANLVSVVPVVGNGDTAATAVAPYGQTVLTLTLANVTSATPATVSFTSACVSAGKASFSPVSLTTTATTVTVNYTDSGCGAIYSTDTVTASMTGGVSQVQGSIYLKEPKPSSLTFVGANPSTIYIKGSGLTESATVIFQVNDQAGKPLPRKQVSMELTTYAGGLTLDNLGLGQKVLKTTDELGQVKAIVNSGTVPTPVRVKAQFLDSGSTITTVSSQLAVGVGLPSQINFSLSQETINLECFGTDGVGNTYTIYAADRSGNPVPQGTAITFHAEGGQVVTSVQTDINDSGIASATSAFVCQEPRPADGRVTITAYAVGEESFFDTNADNVYNGPEYNPDGSVKKAGEPFQDLGNIVLDRWFDGLFDPKLDEFRTLGDADSGSACVTSFVSQYPQFSTNAGTPSRPRTCDRKWSNRVYVRRAVETVMSTSEAGLAWVDGERLGASCQPQWVSKHPALDWSGDRQFTAPDSASEAMLVKSYPIRVGGNNYIYVDRLIGNVNFHSADANSVRWNPLARGTQFSIVAVSKGLDVKVGGTPVVNTPSVPRGGISYEFTEATSGVFTIRVVSPSGVTTDHPVAIEYVKPGDPLPDGACAR